MYEGIKFQEKGLRYKHLEYSRHPKEACGWRMYYRVAQQIAWGVL